MAAKLGQRLERIKAAVKAFEVAQAKYAAFGAQDTEPDGVFQYTLAKAIAGSGVNLPTTGRDWQLFTSSMKCGTAARALTAACRKAVELIRGTPVEDVQKVKAYLRDYCWRVNVD